MAHTSVQTMARAVVSSEHLQPRSHGGAVAACYAGIVVAVLLGYLLDRVVATPVAASVFLAVVLVTVVWLHPAFVRRGRARRTR